MDGIDRKIYSMGEYTAATMGSGAVVFADSEILEEAIRWCDYRYSEEGYMTTNYGIEGETFYYDEDGNPMLMDLLVNNPEGLSMGFAQEIYLVHNGSVIFLLDREENQVPESGIIYNDIWRKFGEWNLTGTLTFTPEEGEEQARLANDLTTYISEFVCKIIMGQMELNDQTWGQFQDQMTAMGLDRVVEINQAAYDRFLKR